jgi:ABC-type lipoprotein release transport system permease subunit
MMLLRIGLRNLWAHKFKTLTVGALLTLGTVLIVVGGGVITAIERAAEVTVVNALTADFQLYNSKSKDRFQFGGSDDGFEPDLEPIDDFPRVADLLGRVPNVAAVVPMGVDRAVNSIPSRLEGLLADLRRAVVDKDAKRIEALKWHVRDNILSLDRQLADLKDAVDMDAHSEHFGEDRKALERAKADEFWRAFDKDPLGSLEFLDNSVGPLALPADTVYLKYIGTDTDLYQRTFDRLKIVEGTLIPKGGRGFLFNKGFYERVLKNRVAHRLDDIRKELEGRSMAECGPCRVMIRDNVKQASLLTFDLAPYSKDHVAATLRAELKSDQKDLLELLKAFLQMDDRSFERRYQLFYSVIAPHIPLYKVKVGDTFVIAGVSKRGFLRRVPVKVFGVFQFKGLEDSLYANQFNIIDIMSFRDLYGQETPQWLKEQALLKKKMQVADLSTKAQAELLFEKPGALVDSSSSSIPVKEDDLRGIGAEREKLARRIYSRREIWSGPVMNIAVKLRDSRLREQTMAAVRAVIARDHLGLTAIDWRVASGPMGNLLRIVRLVLLFAVLTILMVAVIIISNTILMTTLERVPEIGAMRAIGASPGFILRMLFVEALTAAAVFTAVGSAISCGLLAFLGRHGIKAWHDPSGFSHILFSGDRLYPTLDPFFMLVALCVISGITVLSTIYPGRVATRISPREAMAKEG